MMSMPTELLSRFTPELLKSLPSELQSELAELMEKIDRGRKGTRLYQLYPPTGPLRRELYTKHLEFFAAGKLHKERACIAGNRVGKTFGLGGYETAVHLTGEYPDWWQGWRFDHPIDAWVAGDTSETTRDIVQLALLGRADEIGTGLIPAANIIRTDNRMGVPGAIGAAHVQHISGGVSMLGLKSYDQGRRTFQGTAKHLIWLDEEVDSDIYDECLVRLMTTNGLMICTFTPLLGLSEVVLRFMPEMTLEYT